MAVNLKEYLKRRGFSRKKVEVALPQLPRSFERELTSIYLKAVRSWSEDVVKEMTEAYSQELMRIDSPKTVLETVDEKRLRAIVTFSREWNSWADRSQRYYYRQIVAKLRYATGAELDMMLSTGLQQATLEALLEWNVGLISDIAETAKNRVASIVYSGLTNKTPVREVAKEIREAMGISSARARRIASDQLLKLNSALDAQRLAELGMDGYEWMHSKKAHPRKEHVERDGKYFKFGSQVDRTDPPGQAPFCGCKRKMVLEM